MNAGAQNASHTANLESISSPQFSCAEPGRIERVQQFGRNAHIKFADFSQH